MKYNFSSNFLKILPPDTNFGKAWESLCYYLLCQEYGHHSLYRLNPPDRGIDIFQKDIKRAYQCKSLENGASGTLEVFESIGSLKTAMCHRDDFEWHPYCFATNANYSGAGFEKILRAAEELNIDKNRIEHLGPEYWSELCEKYSNKIQDRFDYRFSVTEEQVIEALKKARFYDEYISKYKSEIEKSDFSLIVTNNRTPVEISIPFSEELSVKDYLDVAKSLLGISLDWTNFPDLNTSAGPSVSVTIGQKSQLFSTKIKELPINNGDKLEVWIKIVWQDGLKGDSSIDKQDKSHYSYLNYESSFSKLSTTYQNKEEATLERKKAIIEAMLWDGASLLKR